MTRRAALLGLCATEIVSWGVLYYTFPVLLGAVLRETGWSAGAAMGAFSTGLVASAVCGPFVGRWIDRNGPRVVMTTGSVLGVLGLLAVAKAPNLPLFFAAWGLTGAAQAMLLYQPAFAALTRWYGTERVRALTAVSLVGGLASTVFAPIADGLLGLLGWRGCLLVLACLLGAVTFPVHFWCLRLPWPPDRQRTNAANGDHVRTVARAARPSGRWCARWCWPGSACTRPR
ncbi:MFS transporter [Sciscionella marina]|uniref:MFS transporter n=1 Tax=Sciscionella marina TaxID=508770 RepID=UPI0003AA5D4A|nr:MFS transporter [Sciscionella marina]